MSRPSSLASRLWFLHPPGCPHAHMWTQIICWAAVGMGTPWQWGIEQDLDLSMLLFSPLYSGENIIFRMFTHSFT